MGDSRFDPTVGTLWLSPHAVAALVQADADPKSLSAAQRSELSEGGFFADGGLHPLIASVARTLGRPLIRLKLEHLGTAAPSCDGWFDERLAVLLARESAVRSESSASVLPRSLVPAYLARTVNLGPRTRPKVADPIELDAALVEALLASGEAFTPRQIEALMPSVDDALPAWLDVLAVLSGGINGRWRVGVWWNSPTEQPRARLLEVVDSEVGLFLLVPRPRRSGGLRRLQLRPVTPTHIWRLLCTLVPPVDEVSEPLSP